MKNIRNRLYAATFSSNFTEGILNYGIGMELNHTCISECLDDENRGILLDNIRNDIVACRPSDVIMHGPFTEIHPAAIDYKVRELGMSRVQQAWQVAEVFNIHKMVVHTGWLPFIYFKDYQAEKAADFWQRFLSDKPQDITLAVENVLEDEPLMLLHMMEKIEDPRVKLCLDIGHAHCMTNNEYKVEDWIRILAPYITHFHIHNNNGNGDDHRGLEYEAPGCMDMVSVMDLIMECCPQATLTIESREILPSLEWLGGHGYL